MNEEQGHARDGSRDWHDLYRARVVDLGVLNGDASLASIYSPLYERSEVKRFMSDHYESLENARAQAAHLDLRDYYKCHLAEALERVRFMPVPEADVHVLELGCGFGSATIPMLQLLPNAFVIASELSTAMLTCLKEKLSQEPLSVQERCGLLQLNAEALDFEDNSFDIVMGAAVLHHLFYPEKVLESCLRIVKPGGHAIFFEPFEAGMGIVNIIYKTFLDDSQAKALPTATRLYLQHSVTYWDNMTQLAKEHPFFQSADDKWLFTRTFFEMHAERLGFRRCLTFPMSKSPRPFEEMVLTHFKGNHMPEPTSWMMRIVDRFESSFSPMMKQDLFTEGVLVLTK